MIIVDALTRRACNLTVDDLQLNKTVILAVLLSICWCIAFSIAMFSNTSSTDLIKLSVNYFTVHYLLVNSQIGLLYIDKLTLIWVSTTYCKLSKDFRHASLHF